MSVMRDLRFVIAVLDVADHGDGLGWRYGSSWENRCEQAAGLR